MEGLTLTQKEQERLQTLNLVLEEWLNKTRIKDPGALSYEHPGFMRGLLTPC